MLVQKIKCPVAHGDGDWKLYMELTCLRSCNLCQGGCVIIGFCLFRKEKKKEKNTAWIYMSFTLGGF